MAKRASKGGFVGLFGPRVQETQWVSGFVTASAFDAAHDDLVELYRRVNGAPPKRVTKTDVIEFLMMGETVARRRLEAVKYGRV